MVEMNAFRGNRNARHTDDLKELRTGNLKSPQIKIAGLCLYSGGFRIHGRLADAHRRFPVVLRLESGPAGIYCDKSPQRSFRYGMEFR